MNAAITRRVLAGTKNECRDIVCLNAAAGIVAGGKAADLATGLTMAYAAIDSGKAQRALEGLIERTRK